MAEDPLDRMGAFDAVMWGIEQDPILRSVIVAMVVFDTEPDVEVLVDRITRMTTSVPRLRQRVVGNPVSMVPPRWEPDPHFDMTYHLRRYHVPADGTDRPLLRIAEQMAEQDFDRDRPLWEMALVQGFDADRTAVIVKLHHSITDGVGGLAMAAELFDVSRQPGPAPAADTVHPDAQPLGPAGRAVSGTRHAAREVADRCRSLVGGALGLSARMLTHPVDTAASGSAFAQSAARLLAPASEPLSPLMHGRSLSAQFAVLQVPLRPLRDAARSVGASLNDAYVGAVAGGLAAYHAERNAPATQVRVTMPVNMRTGGDVSAGNRWVPARFTLPIDDGDAAERVERIAPILSAARSEPALAMSDTFYRLLTALPRSVTTSISAAMMKGCDVAISNVPGPPVPLFAAGAEALAVVPFGPRAGAAANISLLSYHGTAFVGVTIDTRAVPDPEGLVACLSRGFDQVLALAGPSGGTVLGLHVSEVPGAGAPPA